MPDNLPEPRTGMADTRPGPAPPNLPPRVAALLKRPATVGMHDWAYPDESLLDAICRLLDTLLKHHAGKLPWYIPVALVRTALARILGCAYKEGLA
jgi:hypothetical protein